MRVIQTDVCPLRAPGASTLTARPISSSPRNLVHSFGRSTGHSAGMPPHVACLCSSSIRDDARHALLSSNICPPATPAKRCALTSAGSILRVLCSRGIPTELVAAPLMAHVRWKHLKSRAMRTEHEADVATGCLASSPARRYLCFAAAPHPLQLTYPRELIVGGVHVKITSSSAARRQRQRRLPL